MSEVKLLVCISSSSNFGSGPFEAGGIDFTQHKWVHVCNNARDLRNTLSDSAFGNAQIWIISADDIDAINAAAAIVQDNPNIDLTLFVPEITGSVASRANVAGISRLNSIAHIKERFEAIQSNQPNSYKPEIQSNNAAEELSQMYESDPDIHEPAEQEKNNYPIFKAGEGEKRALTIAVVSAGGGAGKSTIAATAANISARSGRSTLCLDFDLQFGDTHYISGVKSTKTLDDLLINPSILEELSRKSSDSHPAIIAAPSRLERSEVLGKYAGEVVKAAAMYFDVVVINTGSTWAEYHAQLLEQCDSVLFVLDQRASSIRATKHALELCMRLGIARTNFTFLLNKSSKTAAFSALDISCSLDGERVLEIKDGGSEVEELLGAGHMEELLDSNGDFVQSLKQLMEQLFEVARIPLRASADVVSADEFRSVHTRREPRRITKSYLRGFKNRQNKAQPEGYLSGSHVNNLHDKETMAV